MAKSKIDPFKKQLSYHAGLLMIQRMCKETAYLGIQTRNYSHARILKNIEELDPHFVELLHDSLTMLTLAARQAERMMGLVTHDMCARSVAKYKREGKL